MLSNKLLDAIVVGAGPAGLACAIEAEKQNLDYLVIEKGCLVNAIFHFPTNLIFFSTPELLEIGDIPLIIQTEKPTRSDMLKYYRIVAQHYQLKVNLYERVTGVAGSRGDFTLTTDRASYRSRHVILATGQYDHPNLLGIPGEDLPKVNHYYTEPHPFYRKKVAVIGGKNSAVEAALDLYKNGAEVTLIHRGDDFGKSVKYWILPDIQNRVREGKIRAHFRTVVREIKPESIVIEDVTGRQHELANDHVFALTGYHPDVDFLRKFGIEFTDGLTPVHDPNTLETNAAGVYIAGVITAGSDGSKVFIENSRHHGKKIIGHIVNGKN